MNLTKKILIFIIKEKAQGNVSQEMNVQMKIMMKGINVKGILEEKIGDHPDLNEKLKTIAKDFDIDLTKMKYEEK